VRPALAALLLLWAGPAPAQQPTVAKIEQLTENRGWNEAGVGPYFQMVLFATISPSGLPTLAFAERDGERQPLTHVGQGSEPDRYAHWLRFDAAKAGPWRIVAERDGAKSAAVVTPGIARPWQVPLAKELAVTAKGGQPLLTWELPDLGGRSIERIRIWVRGGPRIQGRFLSVQWISPELPPTATSFAIPLDLLKEGERYIFQVTLENLEGGVVKNRSMAFTDPYTH